MYTMNRCRANILSHVYRQKHIRTYTILDKYISCVNQAESGLIKDEAQMKVVERLDDLLAELKSHRVDLNKYLELEQTRKNEIAAHADNIFREKLKQQQRSLPHSITEEDDKLKIEAEIEAQRLIPPTSKPRAPKGIYLQGNVGVGKTFLMDLFHQSANEVFPDNSSVGNLRMHFNSAMMELHTHMHAIEQELMHQNREANRERKIDPGKLAVIAARRRRMIQMKESKFGKHAESFTVADVLDGASKQLFELKAAENCHLGVICFDELQVPDAFTAIAVMSMFRVMFKEEAVLVCTSNCSPYELNDNAWFEKHYDDFLHTIQDRCDIIDMNSKVDYRRVQLFSWTATTKAQEDNQHASSLPFRCYYYPDNEHSTNCLDDFVKEYSSLYLRKPAGDVQYEDIDVKVMFNRTVSVTCVKALNVHLDIARLNFSEFFSKAIGPTDCMAIAKKFKLICIDGIPRLDFQKRNEARRFITLVDEIYNEGCLLACTSSAEPDKLFMSDSLSESFLDMESIQFEAEALVDAKSRIDTSVVGGVSPDAATQVISRSETSRKRMEKKIGGEEERFAFKRAVSRIMEMQSDPYLQKHIAQFGE